MVPVCEGADFAGGDVTFLPLGDGGSDAYEEDLAHQRGDGCHEWFDAFGEVFAGGLKALLDEDAGAVDIGVPIELGVDEGESNIRI